MLWFFVQLQTLNRTLSMYVSRPTDIEHVRRMATMRLDYTQIVFKQLPIGPKKISPKHI